jgi:hypothetical protein
LGFATPKATLSLPLSLPTLLLAQLAFATSLSALQSIHPPSTPGFRSLVTPSTFGSLSLSPFQPLLLASPLLLPPLLLPIVLFSPLLAPHLLLLLSSLLPTSKLFHPPTLPLWARPPAPTSSPTAAPIAMFSLLPTHSALSLPVLLLPLPSRPSYPLACSPSLVYPNRPLPHPILARLTFSTPNLFSTFLFQAGPSARHYLVHRRRLHRFHFSSSQHQSFY